MRVSTLRIFLYVIVLFTSTNNAYAICTIDAEQSTLSAPSNSQKTVIYYVNGMKNDASARYESMQHLCNTTRVNLIQRYRNESFLYKQSINETEGFIEDLKEVFLQRGLLRNRLNSQRLTWLLNMSDSSRAIALIQIDSNLTGAGSLVTDESSITDLELQVDDAADAYLELMAKYSVELTALNRHVDSYLDDLRDGRRVMLVAHSQGNLFANRALNEIYSQHPQYRNSIGVVGVASPAANVVQPNEYVTATDDIVINSLRLVTPDGVLGANVNNNSFSDIRGFTNHGFVDAYLAYWSSGTPMPSLTKFESQLYALRDRLVEPEPLDESTSEPEPQPEPPSEDNNVPIISSFTPLVANVRQDTVFTMDGSNLPSDPNVYILQYGLSGGFDTETRTPCQRITATVTRLEYSCRPTSVIGATVVVDLNEVGEYRRDIEIRSNSGYADWPNAYPPMQTDLDILGRLRNVDTDRFGLPPGWYCKKGTAPRPTLNDYEFKYMFVGSPPFVGARWPTIAGPYISEDSGSNVTAISSNSIRIDEVTLSINQDGSRSSEGEVILSDITFIRAGTINDPELNSSTLFYAESPIQFTANSSFRGPVRCSYELANDVEGQCVFDC